MKADFSNDELIRVIQESVDKVEQFEIEGKHFTSVPIHRVPRAGQAAALQVHSLDAVADYITSAFDAEAVSRDSIAVIVVGPTEVLIEKSINDKREDDRWTILRSTAHVPRIGITEWADLETAVISLQAGCFQTPARDALIGSLGKIVSSESLELGDDGVSQNVVFQSGLKRAEGSIENPVFLAPFRTFSEIPQPESPFIVRLKKEKEHAMRVSFFEADGGAWRLEACQAIKAYLDEKLTKGSVPVLA